jgi:hypothetical protein
VLAVFSCYLFYPGFDGHVNLRFLVPGLPALFVLLATSLVLASARVRETWRAIIVAALVVAVAVRGIDYATENLAFDTRGERRYEVIAEAIAQRLPPDAVILAMQHSGSVRYYSGREMVRYDQVPPRRLDRLMKRLRNLDRPAYVLLDEWEVPVFQKLFEGSSPLAGLDWPPAIELEQVKVRVWDLGDRQRGQPPRTGDTEVVPWPYPR